MQHFLLAIIIGSEGKGMSRLLKEKCDFLYHLPMVGHVTSLNASVAAALLMYEVYRKRQEHERITLMQNILLVDGYNMIGAWKELRALRDTNLEEARNRLIELMAEYKAAMGWRVIVVFDAHLVPGTEQFYIQHAVEVIFTRKNETADERIEKLSKELKGRKIQIYVATSDMTEQNVIFGHGALTKICT